VPAVGAACRRLAAEAAGRLGELRGVAVQSAADGAPIVRFTVEGYAPADVATVLETAAGVKVRSGFHCAALIHEHLGTRHDGTVRASFGPFNTGDDVSALTAAVAELAG
jgi:selenocysteine lyase/cysteine desulfurase